MTAKCFRFRARYRGGIWSIWRVDLRNDTARIVASGFKLADVLDSAAMRKGTPLPAAPAYPLGRLRAM